MRTEVLDFTTYRAGLVMIADISNGNGATADVFFLVALVLFLIGAVAYFVVPAIRFAPVIVALGLACVSLAWLVL